MLSDRPLQRISDIARFCGDILEYTRGMTFEVFETEKLTVDATCYCLLKIAEAAKKLDTQALEFASKDTWTELRLLANRLRHEYDEVRLARIWGVIEFDIPVLKRTFDEALRNISIDPESVA